jgi:hypothetical protein
MLRPMKTREWGSSNKAKHATLTLRQNMDRFDSPVAGVHRFKGLDETMSRRFGKKTTSLFLHQIPPSKESVAFSSTLSGQSASGASGKPCPTRKSGRNGAGSHWPLRLMLNN